MSRSLARTRLAAKVTELQTSLKRFDESAGRLAGDDSAVALVKLLERWRYEEVKALSADYPQKSIELRDSRFPEQPTIDLLKAELEEGRAQGTVHLVEILHRSITHNELGTNEHAVKRLSEAIDALQECEKKAPTPPPKKKG